MQYGVMMNREELYVALLLLGTKQLSDVVSVPEDYKPREDTIRDMILKNFLVEDGGEGKPGWNDFVRMVLCTATNAQSELHIDTKHDLSCRLFFQGDTMILLTFGEGDGYILYYIPVIPKAVGGLANTLGWLEEPMKKLSAEAAVQNDDATTSDVPAEVLFELRGWLLGKPDIQARLLYKNGTYTYTWRDADGDAGSKQVSFYEMVQQLIPWVVKAHGRSIQTLEDYDVTV